MTIAEIIEQRGIEEVLHFTTNLGLTGILASNRLLARQTLPSEECLQHILRYNCEDRSKDQEWHGYVNLSITSVNTNLFNISKGKWHPDLEHEGWWCILVFSPDIMEHVGVHFTTTNNMYWNGVTRGVGPSALEALFADTIINYPGRQISRSARTATNQPTCPQAEVLYPNSVSLDFLRRIYLKTDQHAAHVDALLATFDREDVEIEVKPDLFG